MRFYETPLGKCPSVTTILSGSSDKSGLDAWRKFVGPEKADAISHTAKTRGDLHHNNVERYLLDGCEPAYNMLAEPYWKSTRQFLQKIEKPLCMEGAVWHPDGFAGAFDCIAYMPKDGDQPTLLDWKTADSPRKPQKIYEYSLQVSAYTVAANYVYKNMGLDIKQAMIVVAIADQKPQIEVLDQKTITQLYRHFQLRIERFTYARD